MDNQQGRLYWLAGLTDGEGNFCGSYCIPSPKNFRKQVVRMVWQISMTDAAPIKVAAQILKRYGIVHTVNHYKQKNPKWSDVYFIKVGGLESLRKLCLLIGKKLVLKRELAQLTREYAESRLKRLKTNRNPAYYQSEIDLIEKIRSINNGKQKRTLRDFTPRLSIIDDKIKSELTAKA